MIGDRLAMAERGATVLVVSDHGFGRFEKLFFINRALEEYGLLVRAGGGGRRLPAAGCRRGGDRRASGGSTCSASRRACRRGCASGWRAGIDSALSQPIDAEQTIAYAAAASAESVFIADWVPEDERARSAGCVIDVLEAARDPETGERIIERAYLREDVYTAASCTASPTS